MIKQKNYIAVTSTHLKTVKEIHHKYSITLRPNK
jgi:hypothetical protein